MRIKSYYENRENIFNKLKSKNFLSRLKRFSSFFYFKFVILWGMLVLINSGCATNEVMMEKNIYGFSAKSIDGETIKLDKYRGKVLLIVNTASKCGFTSQYQGLEKIYKKYKDQGFTVLGFPCNQFASQEPGNEKAIKDFCQINYGVTFPLFEKIEVNGDNAHPLYKYLTRAQSGLFGDAIKWNFTKFLINKEGVPVDRFAPITKPGSITDDIEKLLAEKNK